jgi:hypothetical protein
MVRLVKPVRSNAAYPMLVTLLPMVTLARLVQERNAESPMLVTLLPMITLARLVQDSNA